MTSDKLSVDTSVSNQLLSRKKRLLRSARLFPTRSIRTTVPLKPQMRASILWTLGLRDENDPDSAKRPFWKAELELIATALHDK